MRDTFRRGEIPHELLQYFEPARGSGDGVGSRNAHPT